MCENSAVRVGLSLVCGGLVLAAVLFCLDLLQVDTTMLSTAPAVDSELAATRIDLHEHTQRIGSLYERIGILEVRITALEVAYAQGSELSKQTLATLRMLQLADKYRLKGENTENPMNPG